MAFLKTINQTAAMPDKKPLIRKSANLIWTFWAGFHLVFQGMALPLHLYFSHHHEEAHVHSAKMPEFRHWAPHEHEDCIVCRALNTLHTTLAGHPSNPCLFTPLQSQKIHFYVDILSVASPRQYPSRAPPPGSGFTA